MASFKILPLAAAAGILLGGCASYGVQDSAQPKPGAQARLLDASGREAGYVTMIARGDRLEGVVDASGLTPGKHGMHIHAVGKCEGPAFASASGHLNPEGKQHGIENPLGAHQGDLPDLVAGPDGKAHGTSTARTSLAALFDADGAGFVVHAAADDNKTDPSGNSGARILCGVLAPMGN
jgi:Cu-Zn family superoxide dismutase